MRLTTFRYRLLLLLALAGTFLPSTFAANWPEWEKLEHASTLAFPLRSPDALRDQLDTELWLTRDALSRLPALVATDPYWRSNWQAFESKARQLLGDGQWAERTESGESRYTYVVRAWLPRLALLYAATGQEDLGRLVRQLTLDLIRRPPEFWIHTELHAYDPQHPIGGLETAELSRAIALTWAWVGSSFSPTEQTEIRTQLNLKGLQPCLNWLENPRRSNWQAVLSSGTLFAAIALGDDAARSIAVASLSTWLDLVEDDGSYGEQVGYFEYGCNQFFLGWWALGFEEARRRLQGRELAGSLTWMVSHFVSNHDGDSSSAQRFNFGDEDYTRPPSPFICLSLAYAFDQGLGTWMEQRLGHRKEPMSLFPLLLRLGLPPESLPAPQSPAALDLPLHQRFENGVVVLRTGWTMDRDVVFALRSGGPSRTGYTHDRGNRNTFALFVDGHFWLPAPGRASYRSPLRQSWDLRTASHSTLTFDDADQLSQPEAQTTPLRYDGDWVTFDSEAAGAYPNQPDSVRRRVWFHRELGWVVLTDDVALASAQITQWHLLTSNADGQTTTTQTERSVWQFSRPTGRLAFSLQADQPWTETHQPGRLHREYSYYPGGPNEGPLGSATLHTWATNEPVYRLSSIALIVPRARNMTAVAPEPGGANQADIARWTISSDASPDRRLSVLADGAPTIESLQP